MERISVDDARRSLSSIGATRDDVADRLSTPWWYYPVLGLLLAQMVAAYGLLGNLLSVLSALLLAAGSGWLVRTYADRTGLLATWPVGARGRWALAAFALGVMAPVVVVLFAQDLSLGAALGLAALAWVCPVVLGPVYDAAHRADLRRAAG